MELQGVDSNNNAAQQGEGFVNGSPSRFESFVEVASQTAVGKSWLQLKDSDKAELDGPVPHEAEQPRHSLPREDWKKKGP